ncbi:MAG: metallophosphoesterase [Candidatus Pacebacteria bacterium]|nr:metallophosphoesterase [Candidatus Paceibacterota bacterium]MBP9780715.1 metallophosphoesterase [Candidatus Paceibacterota bacterium]
MNIVVFVGSFLGMIGLTSYVVFRVGQTVGLLKGTGALVAGVLMILLPLFLVLTMALGRSQWSPVTQYFYVPGAVWLPYLLYLFIASVIVGILYFVSIKFSLGIPVKEIALGMFIVVTALIGYGLWNARNPQIITYEIDSAKLAKDWSGKTIVLVADTHLGVVWREKFMSKVVRLINQQKADLVLLPGDIIDGPVFPYEKGLAPLGDINSTFGVVFTPGNHEGYSNDQQKFYSAISNVTTVLIDKTLDINNTHIVGLDYRAQETEEQFLARLKLSGFTDDMPSIVMLHDPKNSHFLQDTGVTLTVSGHTHCGQFWPVSAIVKSMYKEYTHGVVEKNGNFHITTCGAGTAMSPVRIGTTPEIVVIKIK